MNADPIIRAAPKRGVTEVEHGTSAPASATEQAVDTRAPSTHLLTKVKRIEHGETGRLDHQARSDGLWHVEPFEDGDVVVVTMKQQGSSQPHRPATGNRDVERSHAASLGEKSVTAIEQEGRSGAKRAIASL